MRCQALPYAPRRYSTSQADECKRGSNWHDDPPSLSLSLSLSVECSVFLKTTGRTEPSARRSRSVKSSRRRTYCRSVSSWCQRWIYDLCVKDQTFWCKSCGAILKHVRHDIFNFLRIFMCLYGVFGENGRRIEARLELKHTGTWHAFASLLTPKDWREFRSKHA